jgi:hypothetical protein
MDLHPPESLPRGSIDHRQVAAALVACTVIVTILFVTHSVEDDGKHLRGGKPAGQRAHRHGRNLLDKILALECLVPHHSGNLTLT